MNQKKERDNPTAKNIRHAGLLLGTDVGSIFVVSNDILDETDNSDIEAGVIASAVGAIIGLLVAGSALFLRYLQSDTENSLQKQEPSWWIDNRNDPWNARVKAGVVVGEGIGRAFLGLLPIPLAEKILLYLGGAIGGFVGGLIAYFTPPSWWTGLSHKTQTANSVSERLRSGAMIGSFAGIACSLLFLLMPGAVLAPGIIMGFCGGLGALIGSFIVYFIKDEEMEEAYMPDPPPNNPWSRRIRAGIQWGACLGLLLGALLPGFGIGLSLPLSIIMGGALASVGGAILSLLVEPIVLKFFPTFNASQSESSTDQKKIGDHADEGFQYHTENPWGPRCRFGVAWGTACGTLIGCTLFPSLVGATAGGAIGGLIGGFVAIVIEPLYLYISLQRSKSSQTHPPEANIALQYSLKPYLEKSANPWSERCRTGTMVGAALGALIGFMFFPPLSLFYGAGLGGVLGGIMAYIIPSEEKELSQLEDGQIGLKPIGEFEVHARETAKKVNLEQSLNSTFVEERPQSNPSEGKVLDACSP